MTVRRARLAPGVASISIVVALWPLRRAANPNAILVVPPGTDNIVFDVRIAPYAFVDHAMTLTDLTIRQVVWRATQVTLRSVGDHASAAAVVSAGILRPHAYTLELMGRTTGGGVARISTSPSEVLSREGCQ